MAEIESYCDSDEEIFFGPVTDKEKKIYENLRRRALENQGYCLPPAEDTCSNSQDGEEGLHTLAIAAHMLSLSSGDSGNCDDEATNIPPDSCQPSECVTLLPPVETITRGISAAANEGSHLEMDAVKFLSRHLPDQNQCGFSHCPAEDSNILYDSSNVHFTSSVSFAENGHEALSYWSTNNSASMINFEVDHIRREENEADERMTNLTNDVAYISDVNVFHSTETEQDADTESKYEILDKKVPVMNWDDVSEISKGEFGIKLSDNEEEIEKAKRVLKVEEIIKFLAEDEKSEAQDLNTYSEDERLNNSSDAQDLKNSGDASAFELKTETVMDVPKDAHQSHSLPNSAVKVESTKRVGTGVPTPSGSMKKPPMGSSLKKPSAMRVPTPKVTPGMEKRPATPIPRRTPNTGTKHQGTPRPLVPLQSPALNATSSKTCARSLLQGSTPKQEEGTTFKTPNAKPKPSTGSKIPHLTGSFSPSVNKSKKFAGIVSPVSQYIRNKPVTLIVNKKPSAVPTLTAHAGRADAENKPPKASDCAVPKCSPFASPRTPKSGKTAIVTKHLGHIKISSSEAGKVPLAFEGQESLIPDGEVSLLLSKEVELHTPTLLRN
ncbi:uncharacterized protein LOC124157302 isoform X2 [Ischnura elegans]|uniref:uncharacterized protein LOC124157302 isoform X2 n=1 Tax=Ischnura elegans TaxID=197161 RepID=UPI001ED8784E|nr:uncharacterized protein LOC124157302 isoform X2 [Ischnura elegans]